MNYKPKYTQKELEIIKEYGAVAELEFDSTRTIISPITGKRISTLDGARARKQAKEEIYNLRKKYDKN